nr:MAG TPA: hypothetical protein [Caudoviricetes sp.]
MSSIPVNIQVHDMRISFFEYFINSIIASIGSPRLLFSISLNAPCEMQSNLEKSF